MLATSKLDVQDVIEKAERIHLGVANGTRSRALLWNNIMYSPHTARPLISVGQLKAMLDLRLVWDDGPPMLLFCSSGIKYVLMKARVYHGLPIVSVEELKVLIDAIDDFTVTGKLWSYADWREALGRDFEIFGDSMRRDRPQTIEEEEDNETLHTSRKGHDMLCTSRKGPDVQDSPGKGMAIGRETEIEDAECNARKGEGEASSLQIWVTETEVDAVDQLSTDSIALDATPISRKGPWSSIDDADNTTAQEASEVSNDEMSEDDAKKIILDHPLPKARQRTNIVSDDYVPEGRLFGAFTTRGEGITQATFRFPLAVKALMMLASTREGPCADEGFLSAQVNSGISLPVHKDKNNHGETWLIGLGDYTGGRLWIESPCGKHPPPVIARKWQESLRGDLVDVRNKWFKFDPRCYHAVEPVKGGRRVSIALFSPRAWKRIPPHALCELQDLGFHPPRAAGAMLLDQPKVERTQDGIPQEGSKILGDLGDIPQEGSKTLGYLEDSPGKGQAMPAEDTVERSEDDKEEDLRTSTSGMDADLQEWCLLPEVSLPFVHLDASDGSISPLDNDAMEELKKHIQSGHLTKSHLCKGCLTAEGPRRIHRRIRDVDKATHTLHIDIAGPLTKSDDGYVYFLVGALRLPGFPLLIDVRLLQTRTSAEVCHQLDVMVNYFESLCFEGFPITDAPRIRRLHSDRAREFTAAFFEKFLAHRRGIYHTLTTGYDPQANGTAERAVGLIKALASRCLVTSGMDSEFWSYAVRYAAQSLICASLQRHQRSPPFGSQVIAQALGHGMIKFPTERSVSGRLLFWDHLSDQGSCILCRDDEHDEWTVYRAGLPVLAPPDTIPTPDAHDDHPGKGSESSLQKIDDAHPGRGIDNSRLRTDEPGKGLSKFDRPLGADSDTPIEVDDECYRG